MLIITSKTIIIFLIINCSILSQYNFFNSIHTDLRLPLIIFNKEDRNPKSKEISIIDLLPQWKLETSNATGNIFSAYADNTSLGFKEILKNFLFSIYSNDENFESLSIKFENASVYSLSCERGNVQFSKTFSAEYSELNDFLLITKLYKVSNARLHISTSNTTSKGLSLLEEITGFLKIDKNTIKKESFKIEASITGLVFAYDYQKARISRESDNSESLDVGGSDNSVNINSIGNIKVFNNKNSYTLNISNRRGGLSSITATISNSNPESNVRMSNSEVYRVRLSSINNNRIDVSFTGFVIEFNQ